MANIAVLNEKVKEGCLSVSDDVPMHIGKRLKRLMNEKGVTTEAMAARCGVTAGAVSNWFATGHITRDNLVICADVLDESLRYLCTGDVRDRALGPIESEYARRDVADGTLQAIITLIKSSPMRVVRADDGQAQRPTTRASEADLARFRESLDGAGEGNPGHEKRRGHGQG